MRSRTAITFVVGLGLVLLGALGAWLWHGPAGRPVAPGDPGTGSVARAPTVGAQRKAGLPGDEASGDPLDPHAGRHTPWEGVDLDAVRAALPNNTYWTTAAPTTDPDVLRARQEERDRWNEQYGKVLSNTATAEEIDAFYEHRQTTSIDYIKFATYLLHNYRRKLPRRDVQMLKLAVRLHMARLEELPRQMADAQQRREAHDAVRRAWMEQQEAFGAGGSPPPSDAP